MAVTLDRVLTPRGELVLRQDGDDFEIVSNGVFLMDTRNGESERRLVHAALSRHSAPRELLIGGLGMGFSLVEALLDQRVTHATVIEIEPAVVQWHRDHLAHLTDAALADGRTELVISDLREYLARDVSFDAICVDVDNGPDWTVTEDNAALYGEDRTALLASRLRPDGVLTVWSAARSDAYARVLRNHFGNVEVIEVSVARGEPDVVFIAAKPVAQTQGRDSDSS